MPKGTTEELEEDFGQGLKWLDKEEWLHTGRFRLDIRREFFTLGVMRH